MKEMTTLLRTAAALAAANGVSLDLFADVAWQAFLDAKPGLREELETRALAEHKLAVIEQRIADLNRMRRLLKTLIDECTDGKRPRSCPILATLSADVVGYR